MEERLMRRMKHAIGLDNCKPFKHVYEAYRNASYYNEPVEEWELLVVGGYAERIDISEREGKKHFWIKVVPPQPDNDDWWSPDQTGFEVNNDICDMLLEGIGNVYVHQLQHVLRLAGINFDDVIKIKEP